MTTHSRPSSERSWSVISDPGEIRSVRHAVEQFCLQAGLPESDSQQVGLCLNEALANVIRHAYAGAADRPIRISARSTPDEVELTIQDWGSGVNPEFQCGQPRDPLIPGGLGLICLRECMSQVRFHPQPDGMILVMTKHRLRADNDPSALSLPEHP